MAQNWMRGRFIRNLLVRGALRPEGFAMKLTVSIVIEMKRRKRPWTLVFILTLLT